MSTAEVTESIHGAARRWLGAGLLSAAIAACIGLSSMFTAALFVQAHSPGMTRGRKRELFAEFLPTAIPVLAALAGIGLALAIVRRGSLPRALWGDGACRANLRRRALRIAAAALVLALATPLLQALCGLTQAPSPSELFDSLPRVVTNTLGILSSALQEDVLVRWLPIESALLASLLIRTRATVGPAIIAVSLSTVLAALAHAVQEPGLPSFEAFLRYGLPKAPAALFFAWAYLNRGILEAWLTHAATNLFILLLLPRIAGI